MKNMIMGQIIFLVVIAVLFVTIMHVRKGNGTGNSQILLSHSEPPRDDIPLDPDSEEYAEELRALVDYNKHMNRLSEKYCVIFLITVVIFIIFKPKDMLTFKLMLAYIILGLALYHQFDFTPMYRGSTGRNSSLISGRSNSEFPQTIKPYLMQGKKTAWYYVKHRNDFYRSLYRMAAIIMLLFILIF